MEEKGKEGDGEGKPGKRIDVNFPQVAGSALAAVIAAVLAGRMGVYGTFIGAGVVSVVATTGGPVFQHFFRRTGEEIKDRTVQVPPRVRQVTLRECRPDGDRTTVMATVDPVDVPAGAAAGVFPAEGGTTVLPRVEPARTGGGQDDATRQLGTRPDFGKAMDRTQVVATGDVRRLLTAAEAPEHTRRFAPAGAGGSPGARPGDRAAGGSGCGSEGRSPCGSGGDEEYTVATTHGTKWRGRRRTLIPAVLTFVLAVGGLTLYEVISGNSVSGGEGFSIGQVFHPGDSPGGSSGDSSGDGEGNRGGEDTAPAPQPTGPAATSAPSGDEGATGTDGGGPEPGTGTGQQDPGATTDDGGGTGGDVSREPAPGPTTPGPTTGPDTGGDSGTGEGDGTVEQPQTGEGDGDGPASGSPEPAPSQG